MRKVTLLSAFVAAMMSGSFAVSQEVSAPVAPVSVPGSEISNPFASRGAALPAVLRFLQGEGVPLVHLGDTGGLKGYLAEDASGRNQVLYVTPDGEHIIAGLMFASGGQQVTTRQIADMMTRFREAAGTAPGIDASSLPEVEGITEVLVGEEPIMDYFRNNGLKVAAIDGRDGGVDAFLVDRPAADGAARLQQVFYVAPDDKYAVAGVMLRRGGVNVTGLQIAKMQERYLAETRTVAAGQSHIAPGANPPPVPEATFPEPKREPVAAPSAPLNGSLPVLPQGSATPSAPPPSLAGGMTVPSAASAPETAPADIAMAAVTPTPVVAEAAAEPYRNMSIQADEFLQAVNGSSVYFTVGLPGLPALYMVADPQCPYCHRMWQTLKPLVENGEIQVRIILIAGLQGSDPLARSLLSRSNPSVAWLQGQGSVDGFPIEPGPGVGTTEWTETGRYLSINMEFIRKFGITTTPFLAYVAGDDRLYTSRGIPNDPGAFLAALK